VFIDGAAELNDFQQRTTGVNPNIASQMRGFLEPSLRPLPWIRADIGAFVRYENFDTQFKMPPGVLPLKQFDRAAWIVGSSYYPRSRRRREDRLLDRPQSQLVVPQRRRLQRWIGMVVLMDRTNRQSTGVLACATLLVVLTSPSSFSQEPTVVRVTAERFTFTPSHIKVKRGTIVEIRLNSEDTNHGFHIVGSEFNTIIPKRGRGEATVAFRADHAGRYTFECSKMCGAGHNFMRGTLTVEE
jgi:cytochrome c oxidase subunit 2